MGKKRSYDKDTTALVRDRGWQNITLYKRKSWAVDFKYEDGKLIAWVIKKPDENCIGKSVKDFIGVINKFKKDMELKVYHKKRKDLQIIWCRNLNVIRGFFCDYITEDFGMYIQISRVFEFRDINTWNEDLKKASIEEIYAYGQEILDKVFIPNKYFYVTPNQIIRKKLKKGVGDNVELLKQINPKSFVDYNYIRSALFGGLVYCPYEGKIFDEPMLAIDLTSAYIYDMLVCKHCMSEEKEENPKDYEMFIGMQNHTSIGTYKIIYTCVDKYISCFKDSEGHKLEVTNGMPKTVEMVLNNYDLELIKKIANCTGIDCTLLYSYKLDYLPQYVRDCLVEEYIKKQELKAFKDTKKAELKTQKKIVNGIYGDTIRKYDTEEEWKEASKYPYLPMQAGVWTTSYCKKFLFELASKVEGWVYSDTDSIYCYDTYKNRKLIEEFNLRIRETIKEYCNMFEYDYEKLKDLGTFDVEYLSMFRAFKQKEYCYIKTNGEVVVKAAGIEKTKWTPELAKEKKLFDPTTKKMPNKVTLPFVTEGSYEEMTFEGEDADLMLEAFALAVMNPKDLDQSFLKNYLQVF